MQVLIRSLFYVSRLRHSAACLRPKPVMTEILAVHSAASVVNLYLKAQNVFSAMALAHAVEEPLKDAHGVSQSLVGHVTQVAS